MSTRTFAALDALLLTRHDLGSLGIAGTGVERVLRTGEFRRVRKGWFVRAADWKALFPEDRHRLEIAAARSEMRDGGAVVAHESAAVLLGLPLYRHAPDRVHVIAESGHRGASSGVVLRHRSELPPEDIIERDGVRCTSLARTAVDVARALEPEAALACLDAAMRQVAVDGQVMDPDRAEAWRAELRGRLAAVPGARGSRRARHLVEFMDGRADGPGESVSRMQFHRLGFAPPRLQVPVDGPDGRVFWIDFGLDDADAWGEFDGRGKYEDAALRQGLTVEQVVYNEKRREDWVRGVTKRPFARWGSRDSATTESFARRLRAFGILPPSRPAHSRRPRVL